MERYIVDGNTASGQKYSVFKVKLGKSNSEDVSNLVISAGNGEVGASASVKLQSKFVMTGAQASLLAVRELQEVVEKRN